MILAAIRRVAVEYASPRTRGDDPELTLLKAKAQAFSPHPRG